MTGVANTDTASLIKEPIQTRQGGLHRTWVQPLVDVVEMSDLSVESRLRTSLSCDINSRHPTIYWPSDMTELQPRNFRYLQNFANILTYQFIRMAMLIQQVN